MNHIERQIYSRSFLDTWMKVFDYWHKDQTYYTTPECKRRRLKHLCEGLVLTDRTLMGKKDE
jgi:hypothetical protein